MRVYFAFYLSCFLLQISFAQINEQELLKRCREFSAYPDSLIKFGTELTTSSDSFYKGEGYFAIGLGEYRKQHLQEAKAYFLK